MCLQLKIKLFNALGHSIVINLELEFGDRFQIQSVGLHLAMNKIIRHL